MSGGISWRMVGSSLPSCWLNNLSSTPSGLVPTGHQMSCLQDLSPLHKLHPTSQLPGLQLRISGAVLSAIQHTIHPFVKTSNGIHGGVLPFLLPEHMVVRMFLIPTIDLDPLMIKNSLLRNRSSSTQCLSLSSRQTWGSIFSGNMRMILLLRRSSGSLRPMHYLPRKQPLMPLIF